MNDSPLSLSNVRGADKIIDAKTSAVVCLVADDATGVPADGLYRTDDEGQVSTGSMSASPKRALVSGAEEGGKRYFMFRDVGEYLSARCLLLYISRSATMNVLGTDLSGTARSMLQG